MKRQDHLENSDLSQDNSSLLPSISSNTEQQVIIISYSYSKITVINSNLIVIFLS
jgi:hypothetical protein